MCVGIRCILLDHLSKSLDGQIVRPSPEVGIAVVVRVDGLEPVRKSCTPPGALGYHALCKDLHHYSQHECRQAVDGASLVCPAQHLGAVTRPHLDIELEVATRHFFDPSPQHLGRIELTGNKSDQGIEIGFSGSKLPDNCFAHSISAHHAVLR